MADRPGPTEHPAPSVSAHRLALASSDSADADSIRHTGTFSVASSFT